MLLKIFLSATLDPLLFVLLILFVVCCLLFVVVVVAVDVGLAAHMWQG